MNRFALAFSILLASASIASAQPFSERVSVKKHAALKQYYEIPNFKLGGRYDLDNPAKWQFGGEGGVTLESLGAGKLRTS